ncbi:hypothetical protein [Qipengyuania marisflavi]|uniref:Argininosuccinate lyase n=1 Tax=Qipengyuania marisflavi TaxID=2486356 RepID=A0A5S3P8H4_9SPHN|nr:hypothetical protein [Qipengyuania marisflavi]TMM49799.1 hypothetical protein FEV51_00945 [Qipengyuania marisflavi]
MRMPIASAFMLAAFTVVSAPAAASDEVLTVVNRTGYTIAEMYISPSAANDWEEDVLYSDVLDAGDAWRIDFSNSADTCWWDVKVVYQLDGEEVFWRNFNFCKISRIELYYNNNTGESTARSN